MDYVETQARTDELYQEARQRFESWAIMDAPHLPESPVDAMQVTLSRWQRRNFGGPKDVEIALGCIEEIGEVFEAEDEADIVDGVGDVCVYLGQIFMSNRMAIGPAMVAANELYQAGLAEDPRNDLRAEFTPTNAVESAGRIAHTVLKREQKIRGMDDDDKFRSALFEAGVFLIVAALDRLCDMTSPDTVMEHRGAVGIYIAVGNRVAARDWKKDPQKGGE